MKEPRHTIRGIKIFCADVLETLTSVDPFDAVLADPPYSSGGALTTSRARPFSDVARKYLRAETADYFIPFAGDTRDQVSWMLWMASWLSIARRRVKPKGKALVWSDWRQLPATSTALQMAGWRWTGVGVWHKTNGRPNHARFAGDAEFVVMGEGDELDKPPPYRCPAGVFKSAGAATRIHPTQKPTNVIKWLLQLAKPGGLIIDPFCGAGSTLIAAEEEGFQAAGGDIAEHWCDITRNRLADRVPLLSPAAPSR